MAVPTFDPDNVVMSSMRTGSIPAAHAEQIIVDVQRGSAYMQLARAVPMAKPVVTFTHMTGVGAYWVDEAERIQTSKPTLLNIEMASKKMGVIIPTTKENLRYSMTDFFELLRPQITSAFMTLFDTAAFSGTAGSPFNQSIASAATAAGHVVTQSDNAYNDISAAMAFIEDSNLVPNGLAALNSQRVTFRNTKDDAGMPIFNPPTEADPARVLGMPVAFVHNTAFGSTDTVMAIGDWNAAYYGVLQGIEYDILTEATLTTLTASDNGDPISLAERDMVALKATMQVGMMVVDNNAFAIINKTESP